MFLYNMYEAACEGSLLHFLGALGVFLVPLLWLQKKKQPIV